MTETVSVLIATYFRNDKLPEAIDSALEQTYDPLEVVVVDDSGTEHAQPVVERYGSKVTYRAHDENRGEAEARVTALSNSTGHYIQFLDDDDLLHPRKIERQIPLLEQSDVGVVYCGAKWPEYVVYPKRKGDVLEAALEFAMTPCCTPTMLFTRPLIEEVGELDRYPLLQDVWLIIEFARRTQFDYVDDLLVTVRVDDQSLLRSPETPEVFEQIIQDFAELYNGFPERVRNQAIAHTHTIKGHALLSQHIWSARAVRAFWAAYRASPEKDRQKLRRVFVSLFGGRLGLRLTQKIASR